MKKNAFRRCLYRLVSLLDFMTMQITKNIYFCATLDGFVNLQESVAGFSDTPRAAVANLLENA